MVLDDDIGKRLYRPIKRHNRQNISMDFTDAMVRLIIDTIDECPGDWGPKAIHQAIRYRGRHDVPEDLVRNVMNAMRPSDLPY
ncbi:hypothetical protein ACGFMK_41030 [Amycolatopsis sp. NPDC049252]|uniref:hypothetical protein n=1 Tax=Amycolatopsis sp. NPDC049252 TaxID=3363933 RepID=UPI00371DAAA0